MALERGAVETSEYNEFAKPDFAGKMGFLEYYIVLYHWPFKRNPALTNNMKIQYRQVWI